MINILLVKLGFIFCVKSYWHVKKNPFFCVLSYIEIEKKNNNVTAYFGTMYDDLILHDKTR